MLQQTAGLQQQSLKYIGGLTGGLMAIILVLTSLLIVIIGGMLELSIILELFTT